MKDFISSVRRGLEAERDALPGVILALGHQPKRFEDYSAQPIPSREACLRGVQDADNYLLLLGDIYGDPLSDTGNAPTEEEFIAARARGIPILVFLKRGGTPDDLQREFIARVSRYVDGRFRHGFSDVPELLAAVVAGLRDLETRPPALTWTDLIQPVEVPWREPQRGAFSGSGGTEIETYMVPIGPRSRLSATVMSGLPERLGRAGRDGALFGQDRALDFQSTDAEAMASARREGGLTDAGLRVGRDRAITIWEQLPSDTFGALIDEQDLAARIAKALRLAGDLALAGTDQVSVTVGLRVGSMITIGDAAELGRRSQAQPIGFLGGGLSLIRVDPEDSVSAAAIASAASEIAGELARRLMYKVSQMR